MTGHFISHDNDIHVPEEIKYTYLNLTCIDGCKTTNVDYCISGNYNIALGKPTEQRPYDLCYYDVYCQQWTDTCSDCSVSSLAVDGDPNPDWLNGRSCSHTDTDVNNKIASWSVDLQGLYYLSWINIINSMLKVFSAVVCCFHLNNEGMLSDD